MTDHVTPEASAAFDRLRRSIAAPGLLLGLFALSSALILSLSDDLTRAPIAARAAEDLRASLAQVLPAAMSDTDPTGAPRQIADPEEGPVTVYTATRDGAVTAVAFELTGYGYGGAIRVLMAVTPDGTLLGARVLAHTETPGLGDKIEAAKGPWIDAFAGRSLNDPKPEGWAILRDGGIFDQFSGASITPRAVVGTIRRGLILFDRQRATLLAPTAPVTEDKG